LLIASDSPIDAARIREARHLVRLLPKAWPNYAAAKREVLDNRLQQINQLEAERLFRIARDYERAGEFGLACSQYEAVCRRYTATAGADQARHRLEKLNPAP